MLNLIQDNSLTFMDSLFVALCATYSMSGSFGLFSHPGLERFSKPAVTIAPADELLETCEEQPTTYLPLSNVQLPELSPLESEYPLPTFDETDEFYDIQYDLEFQLIDYVAFVSFGLFIAIQNWMDPTFLTTIILYYEYVLPTTIACIILNSFLNKSGPLTVIDQVFLVAVTVAHYYINATVGTGYGFEFSFYLDYAFFTTVVVLMLFCLASVEPSKFSWILQLFGFLILFIFCYHISTSKSNLDFNWISLFLVPISSFGLILSSCYKQRYLTPANLLTLFVFVILFFTLLFVDSTFDPELGMVFAFMTPVVAILLILNVYSHKDVLSEVDLAVIFMLSVFFFSIFFFDPVIGPQLVRLNDCVLPVLSGIFVLIYYINKPTFTRLDLITSVVLSASFFIIFLFDPIFGSELDRLSDYLAPFVAVALVINGYYQQQTEYTQADLAVIFILSACFFSIFFTDPTVGPQLDWLNGYLFPVVSLILVFNYHFEQENLTALDQFITFMLCVFFFIIFFADPAVGPELIWISDYISPCVAAYLIYFSFGQPVVYTPARLFSVFFFSGFFFFIFFSDPIVGPELLWLDLYLLPVIALLLVLNGVVNTGTISVLDYLFVFFSSGAFFFILLMDEFVGPELAWMSTYIWPVLAIILVNSLITMKQKAYSIPVQLFILCSSFIFFILLRENTVLGPVFDELDSIFVPVFVILCILGFIFSQQFTLSTPVQVATLLGSFVYFYCLHSNSVTGPLMAQLDLFILPMIIITFILVFIKNKHDANTFGALIAAKDQFLNRSGTNPRALPVPTQLVIFIISVVTWFLLFDSSLAQAFYQIWDDIVVYPTTISFIEEFTINLFLMDHVILFLLFGLTATTFHASQTAFIIWNPKFNGQLDFTGLLSTWALSMNILCAIMTTSVITTLPLRLYGGFYDAIFYNPALWNNLIAHQDTFFIENYWRYFTVLHNHLLELVTPNAVNLIGYAGVQYPMISGVATPLASVDISVAETFCTYLLSICHNLVVYGVPAFVAIPSVFSSSHLSGLGTVSSFFADGLSLWLLWLTFSVMYVAHLTLLSESTNKSYTEQYVWVGCIHVLVVFCFVTKDLLHFFFAFEAMLIPLFYLIGRNGSRSERARAAFFLLVFTLAGSIFLWYAVLYMTFVLGCTRIDSLIYAVQGLDIGTCTILWWCLFLGFAFKVPLVPFHLWLTVAHVEAPTVGSILLAGLILKLGGYGMIRFILLVFPLLSNSFVSIVLAICCIGYTFATLSAIRQLDLKRFVAYTSIAHMNFGLAVLFTVKEIGFMAFCHTMISHGIIASALFLLVGFIYRQVGLRDTLYLRGLANITPYFAMFWFIFSMANVGMPLLSGFPGEFYGMIALAMSNRFVLLAFAVGFYFTAVYTFLNVSRILFGSSSRKLNYDSLLDLSIIEMQAVLYLVVWSLVLGMFPDIIFCTIGLDYGMSVRAEHFVSLPRTLPAVEQKRLDVLYFTNESNFRIYDIRYNTLPMDITGRIGVKKNFGPLAQSAYSYFLNAAQWSQDGVLEYKQMQQTHQLFSSSNLSFMGSVNFKSKARALYEGGDLFIADPNNTMHTAHGQYANAKQRLVYSSDNSLHHIEDWVLATPDLWVETITGIVLDIKTGSVVLDRTASLPDSDISRIVRGRYSRPQDYLLPSMDNSYIVSYKSLFDPNRLKTTPGVISYNFFQNHPTCMSTMVNYLEDRGFRKLHNRFSAIGIERTRHLWKNILTDKTFCTPHTKSSEEAVVLPNSSLTTFKIPEEHKFMAIYNRTRPSILSTVHTAKVVFPEVLNQDIRDNVEYEHYRPYLSSVGLPTRIQALVAFKNYQDPVKYPPISAPTYYLQCGPNAPGNAIFTHPLEFIPPARVKVVPMMPEITIGVKPHPYSEPESPSLCGVVRPTAPKTNPTSLVAERLKMPPPNATCEEKRARHAEILKYLLTEDDSDDDDE